MTPLFTALERFGPSSGDAWEKYISWSKLAQLDELLSLDVMLCPPVLKEMKREFWEYASDLPVFGYFTSLDFLKLQLRDASNYSLICAFHNPTSVPSLPIELSEFEFCGFDLLEVGGGVSTLTNCGGFPLAFDDAELSPKGLITTYERAEEVRASLREKYPEESHADCDLWAVFRARE